jgi:hypothetical protein
VTRDESEDLGGQALLDDGLVKLVLVAPREVAVQIEPVLRRFVDDLCENPTRLGRKLARFSKEFASHLPPKKTG